MSMRLPHYCVVGGGISGLATAYFLSLAKPPGTYRVTLFESSSRFGGWIHSIRNPKTGAVYELGPHSARTTGPRDLLLQMAYSLDLQNSMQWLCSDHDASKRYIFADDQLVAVSPLQLIPKKPFTRSSAGLLLRRLFSRRPPITSDLSVDEFLRTRLDDEFADYLGSSTMRGIYAGDSRELSTYACLPMLVQSEKLGPNLLLGLLRAGMTGRLSPSSPLPTWLHWGLGALHPSIPRRALAWSLSNGMQTLIDTLVEKLRQMDHTFTLRLSSSVQRILRSSDHFTVQWTHHLSGQLSTLPDIDTIFLCCPSYESADLLREVVPHTVTDRLQKDRLPWANVAASVLELDSSSSQPPVRGFGHLVPRMVDPYVLGIIYDSVAFPRLDSPHRSMRYTVMMKPHSEWLTTDPHTVEQHILSESLAALKRHLKLNNITLADHRSTLLRNCIPQYPVGHMDNVSSVRSSLQSVKHAGGIYLVGFSYDGVGLRDAVNSALKAVNSAIASD